MRKRLAEEDTAGAGHPVERWLVGLIPVVAPIGLVGEAGHEMLDRLGQMLAHHLFHFLFVGGAVVVFAVYAIVDIRRHGRPSFSWRLRKPRAAHEPPLRD